MYFTGGKRQRGGGRRFLRRREMQAIQAEKSCHGEKRNSFVAIHERMVAGNSKRISRSQIDKVCTLVFPFISRARQRGFEHALIANPRSPAEAPELTFMNDENFLQGEPAQVPHFARALSVSRYSTIRSSTTSMAFSKSGSYGVSRTPPSGSSVTWSHWPCLRSSLAISSFGRMTPVELPILLISSFIGASLPVIQNA